ncbi:MAG TPA: sigma-70 family RNA polymerase sigma factor [Bryobacteraceae bacterium]|nr:sigma-70 family RNA polymerase sigma factor [Bryobacteraceae bacterium]
MRQFVEAALRIGHANWDAIEELLGDEPDSSIQPLLAAIETAGLVIRDEPETVISTDSDDPVNVYIQEIGTVPRLTAAREAELLTIMQSGTRGAEIAKKDLIEANLRIPVTVARRYANDVVHVLDLIQEGNNTLMDAVDRFDPSSGCRFSPYAYWCVRRRIQRAISFHSFS